MIAEPLDSYLSGCEPSATGALAVRGLYSRAINRDLAQRCVQPSDGDSLFARANESSWTTPSLAYARFVGLDDGTASTAEVAHDLARILGCDPPALVLSPHGPLPTWARYAQTVFIEDQQRGVQGVDPRQAAPSERTLDACRRALALLARSWPDMAGTTATLVRELRWFNAPGGSFGSATLTQAYGALFLTPGSRLDLYESLVHESSHFELTARMALDKLLVNAQERAPSPFRDAERPLSRVLHATFVCARLIRGYERCDPLLQPDEQQSARTRRTRFRGDLADGLRTLADRATWTPRGARMFERLSREFELETAREAHA